MTEERGGRDRLRELLDAVLDEDNHTLDDMAGDAYSSPYHFNRQLSRGAGEPPVAMKRRVLLERAAWQLRQGASVTDTAFEAGYESVEGFSRAFARAYGHPPSALKGGGTAHWLTAPNGIHFHPPFSLWVEAEPDRGSAGGGGVTTLLLQHDVEDTRLLLEAAKQLPEERFRERRDAWADRVVDALCDPPESFVLGGIIAHVVTHSAGRRLLARQLLTEDGVFAGEPLDSPALSGDPLNWMKRHS